MSRHHLQYFEIFLKCVKSAYFNEICLFIYKNISESYHCNVAMKYFGIIDKNFAAIFQLQWKIGNISDMFLQYSVLWELLTHIVRMPKYLEFGTSNIGKLPIIFSLHITARGHFFWGMEQGWLLLFPHVTHVKTIKTEDLYNQQLLAGGCVTAMVTKCNCTFWDFGIDPGGLTKWVTAIESNCQMVERWSKA